MSGTQIALTVSSGLRVTVRPSTHQPCSIIRIMSYPSSVVTDAEARYPYMEWKTSAGFVRRTVKV